MNAKTLLTALVLVFLTVPAAGGELLAGKTYRLDVLRDGETHFDPVCATFERDGRLSIARSSLSMAWSRTPERPDMFQAVTNPDKRGIQPYHVGLHGLVISGVTVVGSGIDSYGRTFAFIGSPDEKCDASDTSRRAASSCVVNAIRGGSDRIAGLSDCATMEFVDPASQVADTEVDPCVVSFCDPRTDPRGPARTWIDNSKLRNRSFAVSIATADGFSRQHCWTFGEDGTVRQGKGKALAWSPDFLFDLRTTFQAVGEGPSGEGVAFYGSLVGESLIEVTGIEAGADTMRNSYGFANEVKSCNYK